MKFSVVMPCFKSLSTIEHALKSVRKQRDVSQCQVVVCVDDGKTSSYCDLCHKYMCYLHTTSGDVGGVQTTNEGISIATGELVHILHPDDWVLDGFYDAIEAIAEYDSTLALYATAHLVTDGIGRAYISNMVQRIEPFVPLHFGNPFAVASVVVRKSFYTQHGSWDIRLPHTSDWEMWARACVKGGYATYDWPLAAYRASANNHTSRLARTADNLRDYLAMMEVVAEYMSVEKLKFRSFVAKKAREQEATYRTFKDLTAAEANASLARELESALPRDLV